MLERAIPAEVRHRNSVGLGVVALHEVDGDDVDLDIATNDILLELLDVGLIVLGPAAAVREQEDALVELLGAHVAVEFVYGELHRPQNVPTRHTVPHFRHHKLLDVLDELQVGLANRLQQDVIVVFCLVIAEQRDADLMAGIVEKLLLEGEIDTLEGHLRPGHLVGEGLLHEIALVDS